MRPYAAYVMDAARVPPGMPWRGVRLRSLSRGGRVELAAAAAAAERCRNTDNMPLLHCSALGVISRWLCNGRIETTAIAAAALVCRGNNVYQLKRGELKY